MKSRALVHLRAKPKRSKSRRSKSIRSKSRRSKSRRSKSRRSKSRGSKSRGSRSRGSRSRGSRSRRSKVYTKVYGRKNQVGGVNANDFNDRILRATNDGSANTIVEKYIESHKNYLSSILVLCSLKCWDSTMQTLLNAGAEPDWVVPSTSDADWGVWSNTQLQNIVDIVKGNTALIMGIQSNCVPCVQLLIANGADINKPNPNGITPLMIGCANNSFDSVKILIKAGANLNLVASSGQKALEIAIQFKHEEIVEVLLKQKDIELRHAIEYAIFYNSPKILKTIFEIMENTHNIKNLTIAATLNDELILCYMIQNGNPMILEIILNVASTHPEIKKIIDAQLDKKCQNLLFHEQVITPREYADQGMTQKARILEKYIRANTPSISNQMVK